MKRIKTCAAAAGLMLVPNVAVAETETFDLEGFREIDVATGVEARVRVGENFSIVAEGEPKDLERLVVELRGEELRIRRKSKGMRWRRGGEIVVTVGAPELNGLSVSSGARIEADGIDADAVSLDGSSGGFIEAAGRCERVEADVSSGARIEADELICRIGEADASSGGSMTLHVSEEIEADASSGGSIRVEGDPARVTTDTSSGGSVSVRRR